MELLIHFQTLKIAVVQKNICQLIHSDCRYHLSNLGKCVDDKLCISGLPHGIVYTFYHLSYGKLYKINNNCFYSIKYNVIFFYIIMQNVLTILATIKECCGC